MAALEAMLAARPILVSDVAGIAQHVRKSGCGIVVSSNVESIRNGFVELLDRRSEWEEMGRRGREYALDNLTWDKIGERALSEYRRVCKAAIPSSDAMINTPSPAELVLRDA